MLAQPHAVDGRDEVALAQAGVARGLLARGVRGEARDLGGAVLDVVGTCQRGRDRAEEDAQVAALDRPGVDDLVDRVGDDVDGDREGDPLEAAVARGDGRVDADDVAAEVDERPARVARVHRSVGLDVVGDRVGAAREAAQAGDDAARDGVREVLRERAAEGEHPLPDARLGGVAEAERGEAVAVHLEHGEIGERVRPDDLGRELAAVEEQHPEVRRVLDHVVVGDHVAVLADERARAEAGLLEGLPAARPEKVLQRAPHAARGLGDGLGGADLDDGRVDALGDGRKRLAQLRRRGDGVLEVGAALRVRRAEHVDAAERAGRGDEKGAADEGGHDESGHGERSRASGHDRGESRAEAIETRAPPPMLLRAR